MSAEKNRLPARRLVTGRQARSDTPAVAEPSANREASCGGYKQSGYGRREQDSEALAQALASKPRTVSLANARTLSTRSSRRRNSVLSREKLAEWAFFLTEVLSLGSEAAQGLTLTIWFNWDTNDKTSLLRSACPQGPVAALRASFSGPIRSKIAYSEPAWLPAAQEFAAVNRGFTLIDRILANSGTRRPSRNSPIANGGCSHAISGFVGFLALAWCWNEPQPHGRRGAADRLSVLPLPSGAAETSANRRRRSPDFLELLLRRGGG